MPSDSRLPSRSNLPRQSTLPRDVVLFSTADWDHPFWTNKQHVATQLAASGFRVLYIESLGLRRPSVHARDLARIARRFKRAWRPLRQINKNLWVASPLVLPWHGSALVRQFNERWLAGWIARQCRRLGFESPIVWTYNPLVADLADKLDSSLRVYHCVDDLSAAPRISAESIRAAEQRLAQQADVVFTTSPALQSRLAALSPHKTHYLPNVADYEHFSQARRAGPVPPELAAIPRPRVGFVGALSAYKVDFELIAAVARARPEVHWVLVGQIGEGQLGTSVERIRLPNVHLLGPRDYEQLPSYLRGFDLATIPCPANPYTAAMFPMKFFEYLAAGLPVVAGNVPALAEFSHACHVVKSPAEFITALDRVLAGDGVDAEAGAQLARQYTWQWRMGEMLKILEGAWQQRQGMPAAERWQAKAG